MMAKRFSTVEKFLTHVLKITPKMKEKDVPGVIRTPSQKRENTRKRQVVKNSRKRPATKLNGKKRKEKKKSNWQTFLKVFLIRGSP